MKTSISWNVLKQPFIDLLLTNNYIKIIITTCFLFVILDVYVYKYSFLFTNLFHCLKDKPIITAANEFSFKESCFYSARLYMHLSVVIYDW